MIHFMQNCARNTYPRRCGEDGKGYFCLVTSWAFVNANKIAEHSTNKVNNNARSRPAMM